MCNRPSQLLIEMRKPVKGRVPTGGQWSQGGHQVHPEVEKESEDCTSNLLLSVREPRTEDTQASGRRGREMRALHTHT